MKHTSWSKVGKWYASGTKKGGHTYHKSVIFPSIAHCHPTNSSARVIDFGCGSGVLLKYLPKGTLYNGYDIAKTLLDIAQESAPRGATFSYADVTRPIPHLVQHSYTHAYAILSLQNMENGEGCIKNASQALREKGLFVIVLNHPCFRIPRQSSWENDARNKVTYRRISHYRSPLSIPITMHPGHRKSAITWSFHHPLSDYFQWLQNAGFCVKEVNELYSHKTSQGSHASEENRARNEIPLFMAICAQKL